MRYNFPQYSESGGGCLVAQEQLNAWIHITGQKRSRKEVSRLPPKDAEYDYRVCPSNSWLLDKAHCAESLNPIVVQLTSQACSF